MPEEPEEPSLPEEPLEPELPEVPLEPELPLEPLVPEEPLEPLEPEEPEEPEEPLEPSSPLLPLTTNETITSSPLPKLYSSPSTTILMGIVLNVPPSAIVPVTPKVAKSAEFPFFSILKNPLTALVEELSVVIILEISLLLSSTSLIEAVVADGAEALFKATLPLPGLPTLVVELKV